LFDGRTIIHLQEWWSGARSGVTVRSTFGMQLSNHDTVGTRSFCSCTAAWLPMTCWKRCSHCTHSLCVAKLQ
jgi:hypothetical protein